MNGIRMNGIARKEKHIKSPMLAPEVRRRRVEASAAILMAQEAAAQVKNDVYSALRSAHEQRQALPSMKAIRNQMKTAAAGIALGRAKQVQYAIDDAYAMFRSFRSNFFAWAKDPASRPGKPRPPRFYRRGKRARVRFDYQDFKVLDNRLYLPASMGLGVVSLVDREGEPLLNPGDRLVEVRVEPCRSRRWVYLDLVIRRAEPAKKTACSGNLLIDLGVARLAMCLDDKNLVAFFVDGAVAKAILHHAAKWHAKLQSEAALGVRHGKAHAAALAARSARQMEDLMKKVALLFVTYCVANGIARIAVGRNKDWKQAVNLGKKQNQLFTFIPHGKLIEALRSKCARAGLEFVETEESFTSKTDHLAREEMGPKPEGYRWLGSRSTRGCFRSSMGTILQADVNGCIGIGRKVGGEQWLHDLIGRLGSSPGTRLVPRKLHVNGCHAPVQSPGVRMPHPRGLSSRAWISTKVALAKAGLVPGLQGVAPATHKTQVFPKAA
jgi:putative transposase